MEKRKRDVTAMMTTIAPTPRMKVLLAFQGNSSFNNKNVECQRTDATRATVLISLISPPERFDTKASLRAL